MKFVDSNLSLLEIVKKLQIAEIGDSGRLSYILHFLEKGKKVYESDKKYLNEKHVQLEKSQYAKKNTENLKQLNDLTEPRSNPVLINRIHKCVSCNNELNLDARTVRYQDKWFHVACFSSVLKAESVQPPVPQIVEEPPYVDFTDSTIQKVKLLLFPCRYTNLNT